MFSRKKNSSCVGLYGRKVESLPFRFQSLDLSAADELSGDGDGSATTEAKAAQQGTPPLPPPPLLSEVTSSPPTPPAPPIPAPDAAGGFDEVRANDSKFVALSEEDAKKRIDECLQARVDHIINLIQKKKRAASPPSTKSTKSSQAKSAKKKKIKNFLVSGTSKEEMD
jgi:hypothetical protein